MFSSNFLALENPREHAVFLNVFLLFAGVGKLGVCRRFSNHITLKVNGRKTWYSLAVFLRSEAPRKHDVFLNIFFCFAELENAAFTGGFLAVSVEDEHV